MANGKRESVKINDKEYAVADLSAEAQAQLTNLHVTDMEIARLKTQLAIMETARSTYARALDAQLPKTLS